METNQTGPSQLKNPIEALSKDEIIEKYKGLLAIAKKAKQAKDELADENRKLKDALSRCETQKEADKNALLTMKEMVEEFTQNKLQLATQLDVLQKKSKTDDEALAHLKIENESLKRQLDRLNQDNDALLKDIDQMEEQLRQVNMFGIEQKQHLTLLELEVNKLKEAESLNCSLQNQVIVTTAENKALKEEQNTINKSLNDLKQKYQNLKETNAEQRNKFNSLKDRFVDVYRKLKKLKECKRILLETQYEYSEAVSNWQKEIIEASKRLCVQFNALKSENQSLIDKLQAKDIADAHACYQGSNANSIEKTLAKFKELKVLVDKATLEHKQQAKLLLASEQNNASLEKKLNKAILENEDLFKRINTKRMEVEQTYNANFIDKYLTRLRDLKVYIDRAAIEHKQQAELLLEARNEIEKMKQNPEETSCVDNKFTDPKSLVNEEAQHFTTLDENDGANITEMQIEELKNIASLDFKNIDDLYELNQKLIKELSGYRKERKHEELAQKVLLIEDLKKLLNEYEEKEKFRNVNELKSDVSKSGLEDKNQVADKDDDLERNDKENQLKIELLNTEKESLYLKLEQLSKLLGNKRILQEELPENNDSLETAKNQSEQPTFSEQKQLEIKDQDFMELQKEYEEKATKFSMVQREVEELRFNAESDLKTIEHINKENISLIEQLNELKNVNSERSKLQEQIEILSQKNEDNLTKLELLAVEKEELRQKVETLSKTLGENKEKSDELQQTREKLAILEDEKSCFIQPREDKPKEWNNSEDSEELETLKTKVSNYAQTIEDLQLRYERKEREHADLLGEMRELNEALKARGDVISRQQESHSELVAEIKQTTLKLQQIENELNKKEQTIQAKDSQLAQIFAEIEKARHQIADLENNSLKNEEKLCHLNEELQQLRQEQAAQDTQSEVLSTSTISRAEELSRLREVDESFEEKYNKLRGLAVKLKKKLQEKTVYITELEKQQVNNATTKTDLDESNKKLELLQFELEENKKQLESQKVEIQKLKSSRKQANVLNLEIEAAEKSLSEATNKLAAKLNEVETLTEALASKENTILQLRKEIIILEAAKEAECTHSKELKEQIDLLQRQIKDAVHSKQTALESSKEIEQTCESLKRELEETRLQLANIANQHEASLAIVTTEKQKLEVDLMALQTEQRDTLAKLKTETRALEDLRIEYLDYKVKAQAVLRKNQNKDCTMQREQEEELLHLKASEKQLQAAAGLNQKRIAESKREIELLKDENVCLQRRSKELMQLLNDLKQQNESMAQEQRHQMLQHQESLKQHRLQIENLDNCHKLQIKDIEIGYLKEIEELKTELSKVVRQSPVVGAVAKAALHTHNSISSEQSKIDFLLMEREDAEGSEEAEAALANAAASRKISTSSRRSHDFMPLDELLNSPMNAIGDSVTTITSNNLVRAEKDNSQAEQAYKELLQKQESRIRHLTSLLAENEQDLAKLTQMNDMLKEELRRQERAEEREKHLHNLEYLKNVVIKFCTLGNGDERTRLVPVLNTILKLSRSEIDMLTCAAKGQKVTTDANSNRGWGNFLSTWGSNN